MRRSIVIFSLLILAGSLALAGDKKWEVRLNASALLPADGNYRNTYGKIAFMPGLELAYHFSKHLGTWTRFSRVDKNGQGSLSEIPSHSLQQYITLGFFYSFPITGSVDLRLAVAPMLAFYKEKAGIWEVTGSSIGIALNAACRWAFSKTLGIEGRLGYIMASDTSEFGGSFTLGGFCLGAGILCRF